MKTLILVSLTAAVAAGCASVRIPVKAESQLQATQGNTVAGMVSFTQSGQKIRVYAEVRGLTPGAHGFHVHDKGDCSAPDASSAGGHFNPTGKAHGSPDHAEHHVGDMPLLVADASGNAKLTAYLEGVTIGRGETDIVGRSVVIHAAPDDFKSQPAGNSGPRVACGVIVGKTAEQQ